MVVWYANNVGLFKNPIYNIVLQQCAPYWGEIILVKKKGSTKVKGMIGHTQTICHMHDYFRMKSYVHDVY